MRISKRRRLYIVLDTKCQPHLAKTSRLVPAREKIVHSLKTVMNIKRFSATGRGLF